MTYYTLKVPNNYQCLTAYCICTGLLYLYNLGNIYLIIYKYDYEVSQVTFIYIVLYTIQTIQKEASQ